MSAQFLADFEAEEAHSDSIWSLAWTDGAVVSGGADGNVLFWNPSDGVPLHPRPSTRIHHLGVASVSADAAGASALSSSIDGNVVLWDVATGKVKAKKEQFSVGDGKMKDVDPYVTALHPATAKIFAATGAGANVALYDADVQSFGTRVGGMEAKGKFGMCVRFSPNGRYVASGSDSGQVFLFDVESGHLVASYADHAMPVRSLSFTQDSSHLLTASDDKTIILHDVRGGSHAGAVACLMGHKSWVLDVCAGPDGRLVASGSADKTIKLWDLTANPKACVSTLTESADVWGVAWKPGHASTAFVSGGDGARVKFYRSAGVAETA